LDQIIGGTLKHEWKKDEKEYYKVGKQPTLIKIPSQKFVTINGHGNPYGADFAEKTNSLYSLSYTIKSNHKRNCSNPDEALKYLFTDYAVYPLEGVWTGIATIEEDFDYVIMIRQPDFVTLEMFETAVSQTQKKKPSELYEDVSFDIDVGGFYMQILHKGPFESEQDAIQKMDSLTLESGFERIDRTHREIYLKSPLKTESEKLETIIRYAVK
jgi:hypothetical protein